MPGPDGVAGSSSSPLIKNGKEEARQPPSLLPEFGFVATAPERRKLSPSLSGAATGPADEGETAAGAELMTGRRVRLQYLSLATKAKRRRVHSR